MRHRENALCRQARDAFEGLVRSHDAPAHDDVAGAVRLLIRLRDDLILALREEGEGNDTRETLQRVNSILSMASAAQYPISGRKPDRLKQTFEALDALCSGRD
ncbi:MAG: hypothetical protein ACK4MV_12875 [Beijerinckiaceae bacterium]